MSEANGCEYCLAAHSTTGKMFGLTGRAGSATPGKGPSIDAKTDALLCFARKVNETRGKVSDDDLAEVRAAGFDDGVIAEVIAEVALNVLTNYFNNVAETTLDFPAAAPLESLGAGNGERRGLSSPTSYKQIVRAVRGDNPPSCIPPETERCSMFDKTW